METEAQVAPDAATQNQASELAETPEVAAPENSAEQQTDESQKTEEDPRDKTVKSLQRRVDRVTAARYQEQARAQQAQQQVDEMRQRLAQYEQGTQEERQQQVDPVALANDIATVREFTTRSNAIASDGTKRFDGFGKALSVLIEEAGALVQPIAPGAQIGKPTALGRVLTDCDDAAAVIHYLGNNPDAAAELHGLSEGQIGRRIARIELELSKPKEPKQSNAPKAIAPLKSTSKDDGGLSDGLTTDEWIKRRNSQLRG